MRNVKDFINIHDLKISYTMKESIGKKSDGDLVFIHGNSSSQDVFFKQFKDPLFESYRMISLDLPGHGASDRLDHDRPFTYSLDFYKDIIVHFIDQLKLEKIYLIGHSLGGHIALRVGANLSALKGIYIFETPALETTQDLGRGFAPLEEASYLFSEEVNLSQIQNLKKAFNLKAETKEYDFISVFQNTDPRARSSILTSFMACEHVGEISLIKNMKASLRIGYALEDSFLNLSYFKELEKNMKDLKHISFANLANAGHFPQLDLSEHFNQDLFDFIKGQ